MMEFIAVLCNSGDGKINYSIPCKKTDIFSDVEKKLYIEYPEYKNKNCYFMQNGNVINKDLNFENNKILPGYPIIANIIVITNAFPENILKNLPSPLVFLGILYGPPAIISLLF